MRVKKLFFALEQRRTKQPDGRLSSDRQINHNANALAPDGSIGARAPQDCVWVYLLQHNDI